MSDRKRTPQAKARTLWLRQQRTLKYSAPAPAPLSTTYTDPRQPSGRPYYG